MSSSKAAKRKRQRELERKRTKRAPLMLYAAGASDFAFAAAATLTLQGEGDAEKIPQVAIAAYNGGLMYVDGHGWCVVDLAGLEAKSKVTLLAQHDNTIASTMGTGRVTNDGRTLAIDGTLKRSQPVVQQAIDLSAGPDGVEFEASIGAQPLAGRKIKAGQSINVNGRTIKSDRGFTLITKSRLKHVGILPNGADGSTSVHIAAAFKEEGLPMAKSKTQAAAEQDTPSLEQYVEAAGFTLATLDEKQRAHFEAAYAEAHPDDESDDEDEIEAGYTPPPKKSGKPSADIRELRTNRVAELTRMSAISDICARYGNPKIKIDGEEVSLEAHAIEAGWESDKVELHALRNHRPKAPQFHSEDGSGNHAATLEAALCLSSGMDEAQVGKFYDDKTMNAALAKKYRGAGIHMLYDTICAAAGKPWTGNRNDNDYIRAAFEASRDLEASSAFSTLSLSNILENVANKALIASYMAVEVVWPMIAAERSHRDFKVHSRYRLDSTGAFKKVGPDGELKHVGLTDAKYTNQLDTFGALISLTRQMQINDDLGAFLEIPTILGRMSAIRVEEALFVLILANTGNFWHADNRNLISGGTSDLGIDGLTLGEQKFLDMVDSNGKPILSTPKVLLCGTQDKVLAEELYRETKVDVTTTANSRKFASNPHAGKFKVACSGYLNNTAIKDQDGAALSNQSSDIWFLFNDPMVRASLAVAFLNGRKVPVIESGETSFNTLGMQWRGYHDFGVGYEDPNGSVKSAGA